METAARELAKAPWSPGMYAGMPMETYLSLEALGSGRLEQLAVSPLHYRYMLTQRRETTPALELGTALHMAVLEFDLFNETYTLEPDLDEIGGAKPRATKAYKDQVAALEESGKTVLQRGEMAKVLSMKEAIEAHPHAAALLKKCPEREVTALWDRNGRLCRARFDMLGKGMAGNIKTTYKIRDFSPWTITRRGYYRAAAHYRDGANRLGREIKHHFFLAVESAPPFDVGVFVLDEATLDVGLQEIEALHRKLEECERTDSWPGQFPDVVQAMLTDAIAMGLPEGDDAGL